MATAMTQAHDAGPTAEDMRRLAAELPPERRAALAQLVASIAELRVRHATIAERRARAAAAAAELQSGALAPELTPEPELITPSADRVGSLISGTKPALMPHVERAQRRERNQEREAARAQLLNDAEAVAAEAARLAAELEDVAAAIERKRERFLAELVPALVAVARLRMLAYVRDVLQLASGVAGAMAAAGRTVPMSLENLTGARIGFWRGDGSDNRDEFWPPAADHFGSIMYHAALRPFDPVAAVSAIETILLADAAAAPDQAA